MEWILEYDEYHNSSTLSGFSDYLRENDDQLYLATYSYEMCIHVGILVWRISPKRQIEK